MLDNQTKMARYYPAGRIYNTPREGEPVSPIKSNTIKYYSKKVTRAAGEEEIIYNRNVAQCGAFFHGCD